MTAWVVRGGLEGAYEEDAPERSVIRIGFGLNNVDLTNASGFDDVKDLVQQVHHYDAPPRRVASYAGQIWAFKGEMQIGDLIILPLKGQSTMAVGEITGRYEYAPPASHTRSVKWINAEVPRGPFVGPLQTTMTVFRPYLGEGVDVEKLLRALASGKDVQWDAFISWARLFYEWKLFNEHERDYKLEFAEALAGVKEDFLERSSDWEDGLNKALTSPSANNLTRWSVNDYFIKMDLLQKEEDLNMIWGMDADTPIEERVRSLQELVPGSPANKTSLTSLLLMADGATQYPPYRYTPLQMAYQLTGYSTGPNDSPDAWERYEHALGFWDKFIEQASVRGLHLRDRLDAQGLVWCVTHYKRENLPDDWPEDLKGKLIAYRAGEVTEVPPLPPPPPDPWSTDSIEVLAEELLWEPEQLEEIIELLQEKRQVIFYGPPGTGKTYVAKRIAKHAQDCGGGFEIVQFHPSYSYEDFVQGFRPRLHNGQPGFDLVDGPLLRIAEQARANPDATFILVIDELNRGNVAKVFGELYFLLEYRDEEVRLQYGGDGFSLPRNLWFICTMNTADRSIALMDAALRRRFYFAPFFPDEPPIKGLLRRWLDENDPDNAWVADLVDKANENLDRDTRIGPSYFMDPDRPLDERRVRRIWNRAVRPYVEEQCFGDEAKLREFNFDRLKGQTGGVA